MARLVDPSLATVVARRVAGPSPIEGPYLMDRLVVDLDDAVLRSEELVAQASGIPAPPPVRWGVIDRATWAETNVSSMTTMLNPIAEKLSARLDAMPLAARVAQRTVVSVEVGVLLGYISKRVLGQYDLLVASREEGAASRRATRAKMDSKALYFVGPNIVETERRFGFVPRDFALWVALHEVTHRFQFDGVGWLRPRFLELVKSFVDTTDLDARGLAARLATAARRVMSKEIPAEEKSPMYLLASPEQRAILDQIQAFMAVVEGHGNFVMDSVGASVIPSMKRMRTVFERRRDQVNYIQRVLNTALGLEMKLRQYELGQHFCETVVERGGPEALQTLWVGPEFFPDLDELKAPERWLERVPA